MRWIVEQSTRNNLCPRKREPPAGANSSSRPKATNATCVAMRKANSTRSSMSASRSLLTNVRRQQESAERPGRPGRYEAVNRPVPSIPSVLDNAGIAELLIREAETATGYRERALQRAAHAAFMWPEEVRRCAANPDSGAGAQSSRQKSTMAGTATVTRKCTPNGATAAARSRKWPLPPLSAATNSSPLPITPKA